MSNYKPTLTQTASQLISGLFKHDNPSLNSASVLFSEPRVEAGKTKAIVTLTDASFDVDVKQATITYIRIDLTTLFSVVELSVHGVLLKDDFDFQLIANDVLHYYKFNINEGFTVNNRDGGWYLTADGNNIAYVGEIPINRITTLKDRVVVDILTEFEPQLPEIAIEFTQEKRVWDSMIPCKLVELSWEYKRVPYSDGIRIDDEHVILYQANDRTTMSSIEVVKVSLTDGSLWDVGTYTLPEAVTGAFNIVAVSGGDYLMINNLIDAVVTTKLYKLNSLDMILEECVNVYFERYDDIPIAKGHINGDKLLYCSSGISSSSTSYIELSTGTLKLLGHRIECSTNTSYAEEHFYTFDSIYTDNLYYRLNQHDYNGNIIKTIFLEANDYPSPSAASIVAYKNRVMVYSNFSRSFKVYDFDTMTSFVFKTSQPSTGLIPTVRYSHADIFYSGSGNLRKYQLS